MSLYKKLEQAEQDLSVLPTVFGNVSTAGLPVNLKKVNGFDLALNQGNLNAAVLRMTIAQDDPNISDMKSKLQSVDTKMTDLAGIRTAVDAMNPSLGGLVKTKLIGYNSGSSIDTNAGNASANTLRVTIAGDDDNLTTLNSYLNDINNNLSAILAILTDVHVGASHTIKTST